VTHLRKIMLEELHRRHYSEVPHTITSAMSKGSHDISTALWIVWARKTFASTKPISSPTGSCHPVR
jgi:hypothetical protein